MAKYIDLPNLKENLTNFLNKKINPIYAKKTEIPSNVSELNNDKSYQTAEEVGQAVTNGVAKIVAGAPEDFDTLKEMSDWISSHETSAAAMNSAISDNSVAIANHTSNSDIHVTKEEKTKWNKLDSDLKDGTITVAEATKATQDAQGNIINETYAKKTEIPHGTVVDDALSSTSTNPVQNKVVKAEFDKVNSNLSELKYGEVAGGNNLLQNGDDLLKASETVKNKDGSYTCTLSRLQQTSKINPFFKLAYKNNTQYTVSMNVSNTTADTIYLLWRYDDGTTSEPSRFDINDNLIRIAKTSQLGKTCIGLEISYGNSTGKTTISDIQIEEGTQATDYDPYIPSVKTIAEENEQQNDSLTSLGKCKNLLKPTLQTTTQNGVTCTNNGDGTYTLNGTADINRYFFIQTITDLAKRTTNKDYKLVGCPVGSNGRYDLRYEINSSVNNGGNKDFGNGCIVKNDKINSADIISADIIISIMEGVTVNNLVFKPMLTTNLNATYDDFVPYTGDGDTLTADVAELKNDLSDLKDGTTPVAKAVADEDGNNIKSTYAKKAELDAKANITDPVFTGSFSQNRKADSTIGMQSHAEGNGTEASGGSSHAEGSSTTASGESSHAEGFTTIASGTYSHAEGVLTTASGKCSHSEGYSTTASKNYSHAEGQGTNASGDYSHAEGEYTTASEMASHAEGSSTTASGVFSHAEGGITTASEFASHAEGSETTASGNSSHAEGDGTTASGVSSHAEGSGTEATNYASHASGKYNAAMATGGSFTNTTGTAFVIGNGTGISALSNAFSVQYDGTVKAKSTITASTTADYAEFFEWLDENPNNEDRVGYFVTLDGDKIKIATSEDDYILGIVSGEPFVLGNGDCDTWNGMYLHDEFRRTMYEPAPKIIEILDNEGNPTGEYEEVEGEYEGTRPILNPNYDQTKQYISRFDRAEWSPVGMLGVLAVLHDGTAKVNGYVTVNKDGIATACDRNIENSYRVIKANTDSVVEIVFR